MKNGGSRYNALFLAQAIRRHSKGESFPNGDKEKLSFAAELKNIETLSSCRSDLINHINNVYEKEVFRWRDYRLNFPSTTDDVYSPSFKKLFKRPDTFQNELKSLSIDKNGQTKYLTEEQLADVKETGTFSVPSEQFHGKYYKWELTSLLSSGDKTHRDRYQEGKSGSMYLLSRISRHFYDKKEELSIPKALDDFKSFKENMLSLIGIPQLYVPNYTSNACLTQSRMEYLFKEFGWIDFTKKYFNSKIGTVKNSTPNILHSDTASSNEIDITPWSNDCNMSMILTVDEIISEIKNEWDNEKFQFLNEICPPDDEITPEVENQIINACKSQYFERLYKKISESKKLEEYSRFISKEQIISSIQVNNLIKEVELEQNEEILNYREERKKQIQESYSYPIYDFWLDELVEDSLIKELGLNSSDEIKDYYINKLYSKSIEKIKQFQDSISVDDKRHDYVTQQLYILERDYKWFSEEKGNVAKLIERELREPMRKTYNQQFEYPHWNYKVDKYEDGTFYQKKHKFQETSSDSYFWRFKDCIAFGNTCKSFLLQTSIYYLIDGPLGYKALFSSEPYGTTFDSKTGKEVNTNQYKPFITRIKTLYQQLKKSREKFENNPDSGLIPKSITRIFNIGWNYTQFAISSTLLSLTMPPLVLISMGINSIIIPSSYIIGPNLAVGKYLFNVLLLDTNSTTGIPFFPLISNPLWYLGVGTLGRGALAATSIIWKPILAGGTYAISSTISGFGYTYDWIMYNLIIKRRARIPAEDSFTARCIAGPGVSIPYYYKLSITDALTAVNLTLEKLELNFYISKTQAELDLPNELYRTLTKEVFQPFSLNSSSTLDTNTEYHKKLREKQDTFPSLDIPNETANKIKLSPSEFNTLILASRNLIKDYFESKIFPSYLNEKELFEFFWNDNHLQPNDWNGLAQLVLTDLFGVQILSPLTDDDCSIELQVEHAANTVNFINNIIASTPKDDLDEVIAEPNPLKKESAFDRLLSQSFIPNSIHDVWFHRNTFINYPDTITSYYFEKYESFVEKLSKE